MDHDEVMAEYLEKAKMGPEQKEAIKAALGALRKAKKAVGDEAFKGTAAQLMKLLGLAAKSEDAEQLEKSKEAQAAAMTELCKGVVEQLEAETPEVDAAVAVLRKAAGMEPVVKRAQNLPPELQAQWDAMLKSREDDRRALEELQKSIAQRDEEAAQREYLAKAQAHSHAPIPTDDLAGLLRAVAKTGDEAAVASLDSLLNGIDEVTRQSALFGELGGGGPMPEDRQGVLGRVQAMAEALAAHGPGAMPAVLGARLVWRIGFNQQRIKLDIPDHLTQPLRALEADGCGNPELEPQLVEDLGLLQTAAEAVNDA